MENILNKENALKKLLNVWVLEDKNKKPFIAKADFKVIKCKLDKDYKSTGAINFDFSLRPQPWWGNIVNPKLVILALNPALEFNEKDKGEQQNMELDFINNLESADKTINWLKCNNKTTSNDWWKKRLKGVFCEKQELRKIEDNIGVFELFGYYSPNFKSDKYGNIKSLLKKELGVENDEYLPTQKALFDYLECLIRENNPLVIIIYGQKYWKTLKVFDYETAENKYDDYIDTINTRSSFLSKGNLNIRDYKRLKALLDEK